MAAPRWAFWAAYAVPLCVLPSAVWRASLVVSGTLPVAEGGWYLLVLSGVSMGCALLTPGLVHSWGEVLPRWVPLLAGRRIPIRAAVIPAALGALAITGLSAYALLDGVLHFAGQGPVLIGAESGTLRPPQGWVLAAYLPLLAWGPLLAAVTVAYHRRRTAPSSQPLVQPESDVAVSRATDTSLGERDRVLAAVAIGAVVAVVVLLSIGEPAPNPAGLFPLLSWDVFGVSWLALTWRALRQRSPTEVRAWARDIAARRNRWRDAILGREVGVGLPLLAAVYGFAAGVWALPQAAELEPTRTGLLTAVSVTAVLISWLVVHVSFGLYYASQYYIHEPPGGLDFPGGQPPSFSDFGYFSVSIATTLGTTDVRVVSPRFRRVVLGHALLAFVFNTGILGLTLSVLVA